MNKVQVSHPRPAPTAATKPPSCGPWLPTASAFRAGPCLDLGAGYNGCMLRLTAYHGTRSEFADFEAGQASPSGLAAAGTGFYFWEDLRLAEPFAGDDGRVIQAGITLQNPAILSPEETPGQEATLAEAHAFTTALIKAGHDGIVIEHPFSGREIVVFTADCIRVIDRAMSLADRSAGRRKA